MRLNSASARSLVFSLVVCSSSAFAPLSSAGGGIARSKTSSSSAQLAGSCRAPASCQAPTRRRRNGAGVVVHAKPPQPRKGEREEDFDDDLGGCCRCCVLTVTTVMFVVWFWLRFHSRHQRFKLCWHPDEARGMAHHMQCAECIHGAAFSAIGDRNELNSGDQQERTLKHVFWFVFLDDLVRNSHMIS